VAGWDRSGAAFTLADVVRNFKPTILVGVSGQPGSFTRDIVQSMLAGCSRPIVFALSNPTSRIEATPQDILGWTNGAAVVATGSPFLPAFVNGVTHHIGQCNNAFVFPGVGLGASVVRATWLPDDVFAAAARAVHEFTRRRVAPGTSIYPVMSQLRDVSGAVAVAVGGTLVETGAANWLTVSEIEDRVAAAMWEPVYRPYRVG
jgi:malate dehydrogenase (oxaloacetate-decarboxylating)